MHTKDYLSIWQGSQHVFYHAGLFEDKNDGDKKYFLLINELTDPEDGDRIANIYVNLHHTLSGYQNWRVRDVEQNFDASFNINNHLNFQQLLLAGEGKLFQVAPIVHSGGVLSFNRNIKYG